MGWKAAEKLLGTWRLLRGDKVMIIAGKDKGEVGVIKDVKRAQNRVIVKGKNLVKKHVKRTEQQPGGIFSIEAPIHVSNVQVVDPVTGYPVRIGMKVLEDGTKVRVTKGNRASGSIIPRPEILTARRRPWTDKVGPKDTEAEDVLEKTYDAEGGRGLPDL